MTFPVDFLRALWGEARLRDERRVFEVFSMYRDVLHGGCRATLTEIATEFYGLRRTKVIAGPEVRRYQQTIEDQYGFEHVGQGQSRIVFRLPDDYLTVEEDLVVKFALSPMDGGDIQDGVTQNETEIHRFETMPEPARNHLAPLVDIDDDARWVIMPYAAEETDEAYCVTLQERFSTHGFTLDLGITENIGWIETDARTELVAIDYGF